MKNAKKWLTMLTFLAAVFAVFTACSGGGGGGNGGGGGGTTPPQTNDTIAPTVPTNLAATTISATAINLSWTASTDNASVTDYKIYRNGTSLPMITATSMADAGLAPSTQYCYQVTALDATGNESAKCSQICATTSGVTATFKIPDTGQTLNYTSVFGEDSDFTINPPSYTDNSNGTITDNVTGLVWQKQDDGLTKTWTDATAYCSGLSLGENTDWRLPTRLELITIVNYGPSIPTIDTVFFPGTATTTYEYWAGSLWHLEFFAGMLYNEYPSYSHSHLTRCVRGHQSTSPQLADNGDGTVTDYTTNLTWQQGESGEMNWEAALGYCENLTLAAFSDWRLPNIKELSSIVDDAKTTSPLIDTTAFPTALGPWYYWSSSKYTHDLTRAWGVAFATGAMTNGRPPDPGYARCVRGGQ